MLKNKILGTSLLISSALLFISIQSVISDANNKTETSISMRAGTVYEITLSDGQYVPNMSNNPNGYEKIIVTTTGSKKLEKTDYVNLKNSRIPQIDLSNASSDSIPGDAFDRAFWLTDFKFPKDLKRIEDGQVEISDGAYAEYGAFAECTKLKSIELPSSLTYIGDNAFGACYNLTGNLIIPEGVEYIGHLAFEGCTGLSGNLILPKKLKNIGAYAFSSCRGLSGNVLIPNSVDTVGDKAFQLCSNITTVLIIDKTHSTRDYRKDIIRNLSPSNTYIETLEEIYLGNDWTGFEEYNIAYPLLDNKIAQEGNLTSVNLNLSKIIEINNISATKDGKPYNINKPYEKNYIFNKPGLYNIEVTTTFNNTYNFNFEIKIIDSTPPELTITGNPTNWTNQDVQLSITVTDNESGVKGVYTPDNNFISSAEFTHIVLTNGEYTFIAVDNNGNKTTKTINVSKIDKDPPELNFTISEEGDSNNYLKIDSSDSASGFEKIHFEGTDIKESSYTHKIKRNGIHTAIAYDKAGNSIQKDININVNLISLKLSLDNTDFTNQSVGIIISTEDPSDMFKYIITPGKEYIYEKDYTYTVNSNGVYSFIVVDKNNRMKSYKIEVSNIDKNLPTVNISPDNEEWTNKDADITITGKDY